MMLTAILFLRSTATARRSVGATLLNRASSRSHAILTLDIKVCLRCVACPSVPVFWRGFFPSSRAAWFLLPRRVASLPGADIRVGDRAVLYIQKLSLADE
jgi:hypothetical protein